MSDTLDAIWMVEVSCMIMFWSVYYIAKTCICTLNNLVQPGNGTGWFPEVSLAQVSCSDVCLYGSALTCGCMVDGIRSLLSTSR